MECVKIDPKLKRWLVDVIYVGMIPVVPVHRTSTL